MNGFKIRFRWPAVPQGVAVETSQVRRVRDVRCGDCEQPQCVCVDGFYDDTAWLRNLADHDAPVAAVAVPERWAA
jgi:hypothetical protein